MKKPKCIWSCICLPFLLVVFDGCGEIENNSGKNTHPLPLADNVTLFISYDDASRICLRALNANTFKLRDSLYISAGVPWSFELSPNYEEWYSIWGRGTDYALYNGRTTPLNIQKSVPIRFSNSFLIKSANQKYLIAYNNKGVEIFERSNLAFVLIDTNLSAFPVKLFPSKTSNKFYYTKWNKDQFVGFGVYDIDSMSTVDIIPVFDDPKYSTLQDVDFIVSNDDKIIYFSAWTWLGGNNGYGSFFVIDVEKKIISTENKVGAFSQLSISPDRRSIYISDPGGYLYGLPQTGKIWKYDCQTNTISVLRNDIYGTDKIAVAEDNRTLFISSWGQFNLENGMHANLIKMDSFSGDILSSYSIPTDSMGNVSSQIRNVTIAKYLF